MELLSWTAARASDGREESRGIIDADLVGNAYLPRGTTRPQRRDPPGLPGNGVKRGDRIGDATRLAIATEYRRQGWLLIR